MQSQPNMELNNTERFKCYSIRCYEKVAVTKMTIKDNEALYGHPLSGTAYKWQENLFTYKLVPIQIEYATKNVDTCPYVR